MAKPTLSRVEYWREQMRRTVILLSVWFIVSFVLSIFLAEPLNGFSFGGVPFGFWMAQQGSIFVFVSLVLIYALASNALDRQAGVEETDDTISAAGEGH
jgi:putative solute:sodium symporter small subunit